MLDSLRWYLRYKLFMLKTDFRHTVNSPKTFMFMFLVVLAFGFVSNDRLLVTLSFPFFVFYWVYVDYIRGVPRKWKNQKIIEDSERKRRRKYMEGGEP